ncbi:MAG: glycosyltransferase [Thermotogaceae bacterium]|nr:glycosyltransferase [Thermotogaceae bacterium]
MPEFSVIVPVLNEEDVIERALKSVVNQTIKDFEIIVVDNGSTDSSPEIAKLYADKLLYEKRRGSINAIKRGIKEATGEIILCADADSIYPPDYLEKIKKGFSNPEVVAVYGPFFFIEKSKIFNFISVAFYALMNALSIISAGVPLAGAANFAIRRKIYHKSGGYDFGNLASQDFRLARKLRKYGKVKFTPSLVVWTSYRRFQRKGLGKALRESFSYWVDVALNKNKITYESYFDENYYKSKKADD